MDTKTALETATRIQAIKKNFYENGFHFFDYFPLILTDNEGEFARVDDLEIDFEGQSQLFFCEPSRSD